MANTMRTTSPVLKCLDDGACEQNVCDLDERKREKRSVKDDAQHEPTRHVLKRHERHNSCSIPERGAVAIGSSSADAGIDQN